MTSLLCWVSNVGGLQAFSNSLTQMALQPPCFADNTKICIYSPGISKTIFNSHLKINTSKVEFLFQLLANLLLFPLSRTTKWCSQYSVA